MSDVPRSDTPSNREVVAEANPAINLSRTQTLYVNFCRVTSMPEELVLDFALQSDMGDGTDRPLVAPQRMSLGLYTGKRLLQALQQAVERYEAAFGAIEVNVDQRAARHHG